MDDDRIALINHLMAENTARLEAAHELSVEGQAGSLEAAGYAAIARRVRVVVGEVQALAAAVEVLVRDSSDLPADDLNGGAPTP